MRLVLDTNVVIAAFRSSRGASAALLRAAQDGRFEMIATATLFFEYESVMKRPEHIQAARLSETDVDDILNELAQCVVPVRVSFDWRPLVADADDDMVLEAAINGRADAIVSFERSVFAQPAAQFGVGVMTPAAAWAILGL